MVSQFKHSSKVSSKGFFGEFHEFCIATLNDTEKTSLKLSECDDFTHLAISFNADPLRLAFNLHWCDPWDCYDSGLVGRKSTEKAQKMPDSRPCSSLSFATHRHELLEINLCITIEIKVFQGLNLQREILGAEFLIPVLQATQDLRPKRGWVKAGVHMSLEKDCILMGFWYAEYRLPFKMPWSLGRVQAKITTLDSGLPFPLLKQD